MKQFWMIAGLSALAACSQDPAEPKSADAGEASEAQAAQSMATIGDSVAAKDPTPAACDADETPVFSCTVEGGKRISVCGLEQGAVQYRFGDEGAAELVIDGGAWASVPYSGGGEAQIKFENGDTDYIVFSRMVRTNFKEGEPNNPAITDGVLVLKNGKQIAQRMCDGNVVTPVDYDIADKLLPREKELFSSVDP